MIFCKSQKFAQISVGLKALLSIVAVTAVQGCAGTHLAPVTQNAAPATLLTHTSVDSWAEAKRVPAATQRDQSRHPRHPRQPGDLLAFHCWYLDGRSIATEFDMTTQSPGEVVDRYQQDMTLSDERVLTIQAQALNDKKDIQLSLFLKSAKGAQPMVAFAGATAEVTSGRVGAIGMTGAPENSKTEIFQVDCRRPQ